MKWKERTFSKPKTIRQNKYSCKQINNTLMPEVAKRDWEIEGEINNKIENSNYNKNYKEIASTG